MLLLLAGHVALRRGRELSGAIEPLHTTGSLDPVYSTGAKDPDPTGAVEPVHATGGSEVDF